MNCAHTADIAKLKSGLLKNKEAAALRAHMKECPACSNANAAWEKLDGALRALPRHTAPAALEFHIMSALDQPEKAAPRARRLAAGLELAAATLTATALTAALYFISTPAFSKLLVIISCVDFTQTTLSLYYITLAYAATLLKACAAIVLCAQVTLSATLAAAAVSLGVLALAQLDRKLQGDCI
ncbi:MAG: hypothetical protein PHW69_08625 [Elusimicrobiaceae bacterium]|nr:hypothetical protein [Elusimicrobiaceae bacterium]